MAPIPRDSYKDDVDFTALASQYPDFAKRLKSNRQLDFSNPESVRQLTFALLHRDFNLKIDLPDDRLCPPVPNRFNYILFIQDLVDTTSDDYSETYDAEREVFGLDIGTGASTIYPLLGTSQRPNWKFVATEIDPKSLTFARRNIQANNLESRIKTVQTRAEDFLIPVEMWRAFDRIDFVMLNPPFYASQEEMLSSAKAKQRAPNSACTGAPIEMIYPPDPSSGNIGGEVGFLHRLIHESLLPRNKLSVQWFTSMIGKLSSVSTIIEELRAKACTNYAVTEFVQGERTRRWGVAWSWSDRRPSLAVARGIGSFALEKKLMPVPPELQFEVPSQDLNETGQNIDAELRGLVDLKWQWRSSLSAGLGMADNGDCWSRKARRRKQQQRQKRTTGEKEDELMRNRNKMQHEASRVIASARAAVPRPPPRRTESASEAESEDDLSPALVFKITITQPQQQQGEANWHGRNSIYNPLHHNDDKDIEMTNTTPTAAAATATVRIRWLQGADAVLFESFCGWLKRRMSINPQSQKQ